MAAGVACPACSLTCVKMGTCLKHLLHSCKRLHRQPVERVQAACRAGAGSLSSACTGSLSSGCRQAEGGPARQVCECVVILRNLKDVSWAGAKLMMADTQFLRSLVDFDKDSLSEKQARARRQCAGCHSALARRRCLKPLQLQGVRMLDTPC